METQRRYLGTGEDSKGAVIGGQAICTIVTKDGIDHQVVKTWKEDRVGKKINPAGKVEIVVPNGLSRQQRRAFERQNRKAA